MSGLIGLGVVLLVIAIVAYALGARGIAGMTAGVGKLVLIVGVLLAAIAFVAGAVA
ncbi:MAG: DUF1328 family protein [Planctomycetota bacterium]